jgi:hypothetical protein
MRTAFSEEQIAKAWEQLNHCNKVELECVERCMGEVTLDLRSKSTPISCSACLVPPISVRLQKLGMITVADCFIVIKEVASFFAIMMRR